MDDDETQPRTPLLGCCLGCQHVWPILWTPCPVDRLSKMVPAVCPWCGSDDRKKITLANADDARRYADWLETELLRARNTW